MRHNCEIKVISSTKGSFLSQLLLKATPKLHLEMLKNRSCQNITYLYKQTKLN